jgi:hypothetical protein
MTETLHKLPDLAVLYRCHVVASILQGFSDGIEGEQLTAAMEWALEGRMILAEHTDLLAVFAAPWHAAKDEGVWDGCPSAMAEADLAKEEARAAQIGTAEAGPHQRALADLASERMRQVSEEGYTPEQDDAVYDAGQLAHAAANYTQEAGNQIRYGRETPGPMPHLQSWPWSNEAWKPGDARRTLVKAGALILAQIEQIDRRDAAPEVGQ